MKVLQKALETANCVPKRECKSGQEFEEYLKKEGTLILAGTAQRSQRPQEPEKQKECYAGKKRTDGKNTGDQKSGQKNLISE